MPAKIADNSVFSTIGRYQPKTALCVLRMLAELDWDKLEASGLFVGETKSGQAQMILPLPSNSNSSAFKKAHSYLDAILETVTECGGTVDKAKAYSAHRNVVLDGYLMPVDAAIHLACLCQRTAEQDFLAEDRTDRQRLMVLVLGDVNSEAVLRQHSDVLRHGRDVVPMNVLDDAEATVGVSAIASDSIKDMGTLKTKLRRSDQSAEIVILREWQAGRRVFWAECPEERELDATALRDMGRILDAARGAVGDECGSSLPLSFVPAKGKRVIGWADVPSKAKPSLLDAPQIDPVQPLEVSGIELRGGSDVTDTLMRKVSELNPMIGYRVGLRPVRKAVFRGFDAKKLREQIEELELRIRDAEALNAPQMRLLRFSDAQLPAMIDTLRKLPPEALKSDEQPHRVVKYAAGYSAGRDEPFHYILYDPADHVMDHAEMYWRRASGDERPMSYWIEPHVALARAERTGEITVFVPDGTLLVPSPVYFGDQLLGTLKLMLGELFINVAPVVGAPGAQPAFIFSESDGADRKIALEAIDMRHFKPLQQQLPWINDNIQISDPITLDRQTEEAQAELLYVRRATHHELERFNARHARIGRAWEQSLAELESDAVILVEALAAEMQATSRRMDNARTYLTEASKEMRELETLVEAADQALSGHRDAAPVLAEKDLAMRSARERFSERVANEIARGEMEFSRVDKAIADIMDKLTRYRGGSDL